MELLLNLAWLLLALPAYWLWRERSSARVGRRSLQCLLSLGCMLVILFPVRASLLPISSATTLASFSAAAPWRLAHAAMRRADDHAETDKRLSDPPHLSSTRLRRSFRTALSSADRTSL